MKGAEKKLTFDEMPDAVAAILYELREVKKQVELLQMRSGPAPENDIIDYEELASRLKITVNIARRNYNHIPHTRAGRKCFFKWSDVLKHVHDC